MPTNRLITTDEPIDLPPAKPTQSKEEEVSQQIKTIQQSYQMLVDNIKKLMKVQNIPAEVLSPILDLDNQMRSLMDNFKKSIPKPLNPPPYGINPPKPKMDYGISPPQPEFQNLNTAFDWIKKNKKQKTI